MSLSTIVSFVTQAIVGMVVAYITFLSVLAIPYFQNHIIYLHKVKLTWFQDVDVPELWGFMHNQVTPFKLKTLDKETLHAWHILPLDIYRRNMKSLVAEPSGLASDITQRRSFKLLREDPEALLVLYLHGAAGTLGSGYRPASYRAIYAAAPDKVHIVAIDYRTFGESSGVSPSEKGLLTDAVSLADWAINTAGVTPERIVLFAQSLGTAVTIALAHHLALQPSPTLFAGIVLVAPFTDVESLTETYCVAGMIPLLSPLAYFPRLMRFFNSFIVSKWPSRDKLAQFVRTCEVMEKRLGVYSVTLIHAKDDYTIPWQHSDAMYWYAVNAGKDEALRMEGLQDKERSSKQQLGAAGWSIEQRTRRGVLREHILEHGLHDKIMGYPIVTSAIQQAFQDARKNNT
ncbi:MAG: hypothetical protein Q9162_003040 [Coniocarpon cinnabarinum]